MFMAAFGTNITAHKTTNTVTSGSWSPVCLPPITILSMSNKSSRV